MIAPYRISGRRSRLAMTLIEITVAMTIGMMVSVGAVSILIMVLKGTAATIRYNRANQEAHLAVDTMTRDIRMAVGLEDGLELGEYKFDSDDDVMILKAPAIDEEEDIINIESTFDYIVYYTETVGDNKVLRRQVLPDGQSSREESLKSLGQGVFAIKPDALGVYVINYQFKPLQKLQGKEYAMPVSGSVRLRNKK